MNCPERLVPIRINSIARAMNGSKNNRERTDAPSNDRTQRLLQADASKPAASAQQIALKFTEMDSIACGQLTPPSRNGMVNTGATASQSVNARNP